MSISERSSAGEEWTLSCLSATEIMLKTRLDPNKIGKAWGLTLQSQRFKTVVETVAWSIKQEAQIQAPRATPFPSWVTLGKSSIFAD